MNVVVVVVVAVAVGQAVVVLMDCELEAESPGHLPFEKSCFSPFVREKRFF